MRKIKINLRQIQTKDVKQIVENLKDGKVAVCPTDTVYGIGCLATDRKAINKIFRIKGIVPPKPLIVLIKNYRMLHEFCYVSRIQEKYIRSVWSFATERKGEKKDIRRSQPTTFILKSRGNLPKEILGENQSLAVRLPKSDFIIRILKEVNKPLISTSLNITGSRTLSDLSKIDSYFIGVKPDLIINAGKIKKTKPSRIIDLREIKPDGFGIKIIR